MTQTRPAPANTPVAPSGHRRNLLLRALPLPPITSRAFLLVERNFIVYRRAWVLIVSGFFEPVFYLFSIGIGIGALVGHVRYAHQAIGYTSFVAPAMLASSAMNGAVYDSTSNVFFKLRYAKTYDAILSTPLAAGDVAVGEIVWAQIRGLLYSATFLVVMLAMGLVHSWWVALALPASVLVGLAFGAVGMAAASFMRTWQDFEFIQLLVLPMFLFSTTFYPLYVYPHWLQYVIRGTPLYQSVALLRDLAVGNVHPISTLLHLVYLAAMTTVGVAVASRRLERLLLK
ncbi:MAG: ABC transporter permease [Mycobacteriales bacterium]|nr:MAG: ABC transporter [Pseudonocardiales bacterium]